MTNIERVLLPLYSHKKDSDKAGKHEEWSEEAHQVAEGAAITTDLVANTFIGGYLLGVKRNPKLALTALLLYHAAVNLAPHPISQLINTVKKRQSSQSEAKPL